MKMNLFELSKIDNLKMELVEPQSSHTWKQKVISLRVNLDELERDRLHGCGSCDQDRELILDCNSIPETFDALKTLVKAILTIFSSPYSCETLFSLFNYITNDKEID